MLWFGFSLVVFGNRFYFVYDVNTTNTSGAFEIGVLKQIKESHSGATFILVGSLVPLVDSQHTERDLIPLFYEWGNQGLVGGELCGVVEWRGQNHCDGTSPPSLSLGGLLWGQYWPVPPHFGTGPTWRLCRRSWRSWSSMSSSGSALRPFLPRSRRWGNWRMMTLRRSVSWVLAMVVWCSRSPTSRLAWLWPER